MLQPIHFCKDLFEIFRKYVLIVYRFRYNRQKHQHRMLNTLIVATILCFSLNCRLEKVKDKIIVIPVRIYEGCSKSDLNLSMIYYTREFTLPKSIREKPR